MQTISGFFKFYSKPLVTNLLNDEKRVITAIDFTNVDDVCSIRLNQVLRQSEAEVSLYLSNPDLSDTLVLNYVNDFAMEYIYQRLGVMPIPSSIKDACGNHRETLLLINQQKLDSFSLPQMINTDICISSTDEKVIFDYD